jgi:hypothetical protein
MQQKALNRQRVSEAIKEQEEEAKKRGQVKGKAEFEKLQEAFLEQKGSLAEFKKL